LKRAAITKENYRTFHNIVAWAKTAEENAIIRKGDIVMIDGETTNRSYEDKKTGEKKYITEVNAQSIIILQSRTNAEPTSGTEETQPQKQTDDLPF
jgi:Single-stranded DNA-binding protein